MKNLILFISFFSILFSVESHSQLSQPVRLTNGNNDRNPSFSKTPFFLDLGAFEFEFLVFERVNGNYSQICVSKIGPQGPMDSAIYLTSNNFSNLNPAISIGKIRFQNTYFITNALVVWQSDKFGRESIFGCSYNSINGWSIPFIIDSTFINNKKPCVYCLDSVNYLVAYESGDDIKYKKFNVLTQVASVERNLTSFDSDICSNPQITSFNNQFNNNEIAISYDKEISQSQQAVYFRTGNADSIPLIGNARDTIAFTGVNHNLGFGRNSLSQNVIFESGRDGNINIYASVFIPYLPHFQNPVIVNNFYDILNYSGTDFPITDASGLTNYIFAYNKKSANGLKVIISNAYNESDTTAFNVSNNPLFRTKIATSAAIVIPGFPCQRYWFAYNKDSIDSNYPSTIYGISFTNCFTKINQNNSEAPDNFSLSQNFPNPFNPKTIINYELGITNYVQLKVYGMIGNEITTLVNERQNAGSYQVEFDGSNLSSGIYFYKLTTGNFSEVKKMILLK